MKSYLKYTMWLTISVLALLLLMSALPPITIAGHTLRKVDLLSDIRKVSDEEKIDEGDTIAAELPVIKPAFVDTCRTGLTCIEDYSDSTMRGMTHYYKAIDELSRKTRHVRIAVFGDSFIEGDIFTADLRAMLQQKYGGCGVGFVDITSTTHGFRPTVKHSFGGWRSHASTDSIGFDRSKQGISGRYSIPGSGAYVELRGQTKYASLLDTCQQASIFFRNHSDVAISVRINREEEKLRSFEPSESMRQLKVNGHIGSIRWKVRDTGAGIFYGVTMDGAHGITLDNFAMRGSSGLTLRSIPQKVLTDFNRHRPYDLIILQYGLNVATRNGKNYDHYKKGMLATIEYIKECFPQASILLVSVGDRDYRNDRGEMRTMPGVKNLIRYQQNIAAEGNIAFWNLYEAMGGDGSMADLVKAKPPKANYDYTHINFRGGEHLAKLLYETLIYGKEQYDRRRAYEDE